MKRLPYQKFIIGTIKWTRTGDSHATGNKWCVNCINMWKATLGQNLTPENAILEHMVIVLHEITHTMTDEPHKDSWDTTLKRILIEVGKE